MTSPSPSRTPALWPLILALVFTVAALVILFWLRGRVVKEEKAFLAYSVRLFELSDALRRPENDSVRFSQIESIARSIEERDLIAHLLVSKNTQQRQEVLLYPYYYDLAHPNWSNEISQYQRLTIGEENTPRGWIYVRLNPANRQAIDRVILAFSALMVFCLGALIFRQRGKETELHRTVSELEQRRAEVIRLERLALAGQLSANIFHDIKKPVLNIKHEVTDALDMGHSSEETLRAVHEQTELFLKMLRELGFEQFVRAETEEGEYCDVPEMVERALSLVKYERGDVEIEIDVPNDGSLPLIFASPHRLIQLFSNLILNAYQAMDGKGVLRIRATLEDKNIALQFDDNGPGIDPELRETLFDPFVTTKSHSEGSGLGLYICAKIAADLHGELVLTNSSFEQGTGFKIVLPGLQPESI